MKILGAVALLIGIAGVALAGAPPATPEIDASTGTAAVALLAGGLLVIRARRRR